MMTQGFQGVFFVFFIDQNIGLSFFRNTQTTNPNQQPSAHGKMMELHGIFPGAHAGH